MENLEGNAGRKVVEVGWNHPSIGWFKFNIDGTYKGDNSLAGCGGICRDATGK